MSFTPMKVRHDSLPLEYWTREGEVYFESDWLLSRDEVIDFMNDLAIDSFLNQEFYGEYQHFVQAVSCAFDDFDEENAAVKICMNSGSKYVFVGIMDLSQVEEQILPGEMYNYIVHNKDRPEDYEEVDIFRIHYEYTYCGPVKRFAMWCSDQWIPILTITNLICAAYILFFRS